jgi:hypothetical protein
MKITKRHCALELLLQWLGPSRSDRARTISTFRPKAKTGEFFPPSVPAACWQNPAGRWSVVGGGVVGEQAWSTVNQIWGEGWWCSHLRGIVMVRRSMAEETMAVTVRCPFHGP